MSITPQISMRTPSQPVQRYALQYRVDAGVFVCPVHELLADPCQQREGIRTQHEADGGRSSGMLYCVSGARGFPLFPAFETGLFDVGECAFCGFWSGIGDAAEVEVDT